jgi:hypothetical protein
MMDKLSEDEIRRHVRRRQTSIEEQPSIPVVGRSRLKDNLAYT